MRRTTWTILLLVAVAPLLATCKSKDKTEPPRVEAPPTAPAPAAEKVAVVAVTLGSGVGTDKKVTAPADTFRPTDTIYASVATSGAAAAATQVARWTYEDGQTVHEETQSIAPTGPAITEFHISKPDGWPKGKYAVEILLDGEPARKTDFTIS